MLKLFKKLLGKTEAPVPVPRVAHAAPRAVTEAAAMIPQVEVAHLSLAAIVNKLPEDLKQTVLQMPDETVTVALPLATIQKQLPTGSVKMSLASLYRQAPAGIFQQARTEDRRMVEVPLSEVFRHVSPQVLPRREQRRVEVPEDAIGLFGDSSNPYSLAPGVSDAPVAAAVSAPAAPQAPRVIQPPMEMRMQAPASGSTAAPNALPSSLKLDRQPTPTARAVAPPNAFTAPPQTATAEMAGGSATLTIALADLAQAWPEPIRSEALSFENATVSLPAAAVTAGLAKGKVTFNWGQLRSWIEPTPQNPTQAREAAELLLPLKVVAPAFLAHSKPKASRKSVEVDATIPALFSGGSPASVPEAGPEPVAVRTPEPPASVASTIAAPEPLAPPEAVAPPESIVSPEPIAPSPTVIPFVLAAPVEATIETPVEQAPTSAIPAPVPAALRPKQKIGELLGNPDKTHWSPPELVKATAGLPGVAGVAVALQEGLLIAAELPEEMKGDTVAAFLPQIFARLNVYAGEMKLGAVEDILLTTNGAHFQVYRLGEIYFAVLGKPGESLPWDSLRLIAEELAHHHQK